MNGRDFFQFLTDDQGMSTEAALAMMRTITEDIGEVIGGDGENGNGHEWVNGTMRFSYKDGAGAEEVLDGIQHIFTQAQPDGLLFKIEIASDDWFEKLDAKIEERNAKKRDKILRQEAWYKAPEAMKDLWLNNVQTILANVGAEFIEVHWEKRNRWPAVTYKYKGRKERVALYMDGSPAEGESFNMQNLREHTLASMIPAVHEMREASGE